MSIDIQWLVSKVPVCTDSSRGPVPALVQICMGSHRDIHWNWVCLDHTVFGDTWEQKTAFKGPADITYSSAEYRQPALLHFCLPPQDFCHWALSHTTEMHVNYMCWPLSHTTEMHVNCMYNDGKELRHFELSAQDKWEPYLKADHSRHPTNQVPFSGNATSLVFFTFLWFIFPNKVMLEIFKVLVLHSKLLSCRLK